MRSIKAAEVRAKRKTDFLIRYCKKLPPYVLVRSWYQHSKSGLLYVRAFGEWAWELAMAKLGWATDGRRLKRLERWLRTAPFAEARWVHRIRIPKRKTDVQRPARRAGMAKAAAARVAPPDEWDLEGICLETVRISGY